MIHHHLHLMERHCLMIDFAESASALDEKLLETLGGSLHGVEKETLRVDGEGRLAMTGHPKELGSPLTHPYLTTDFSRAQLEFVTPPLKSEEEVVNCLHSFHQTVYQSLEKELLWPLSAPARLPSPEKIPLAEYGPSLVGQEKLFYRRGLATRYGSRMQSYSGVHYNYSFGENFWYRLQQKMEWKGDLRRFTSEGYLHIARNFLRHGWLTTYLFGATPAVDQSLFDGCPSLLRPLGDDGYYHPEATSLRMSRLGYYSRVQSHFQISYNNLEEYIHDLQQAMVTPAPSYVKVGLWRDGKRIQLSDSLLQLEAEHYSRIRPKPKMVRERAPLETLREEGINYVEVRAIDLNPRIATGIGIQELRFFHLFLFSALFRKSPPLGEEELRESEKNQDRVALQGRALRLRLREGGKSRYLKEWAMTLLDELQPWALLLDQTFGGDGYEKSLAQQRMKVEDVEQTPSAMILQSMRESGSIFLAFGVKEALRWRAHFVNEPLEKEVRLERERIARHSLREEKAKEELDEFLLFGYEEMELSTQMIIREAQRRAVKVEVLLRPDNIIRLSRGGHSKIIKQATITPCDSSMSYLLMQNKQATKLLLREVGVPVAEGTLYRSFDLAVREYIRWESLELVIKPNCTNYGIAVHYVAAGDSQGYRQAVEKAMVYEGGVIVEERIKGEEFRFLVIGDRTVAVCQRLPANVTGDGVSTVAELIDRKNHDPKSYKLPKYYIKKGEEELRLLQEKGFTFATIVPEGMVLFLRLNSNVSTGGDPIDVTDKIASQYKKVAEKAANKLEARFCGIDMIIDGDPAVEGHRHIIIELNYNPALFLHRYPVRGKAYPVEEAALDEMGFPHLSG